MKKVLLLFTLCLNHVFVHAQIPSVSLPQILPASPQATALAKYINYPVDYSTGLTNIAIPLYEIKIKDITIPISISYHSSGLKVNENSGWVGAGWTLNAEPAISRSVHGRPDEQGYLITSYSANPLTDNPYKISLANGDIEEEPDEFYYKLLSNSGGFYFNRPTSNPYTIVTHPYDPISVTYINPQKIEITDDKGLFYRFGTSSTNTYGLERTNGVTTCLKATEVSSNTSKEKVLFNYSSFDTEYLAGTTDRVTVEDVVGGGLAEIPDIYTGCYGCGLPVINENYSRYKLSIDPANLGQVVWAANGPATITSSSATIETMKISNIGFKSGRVRFEKNELNNLNTIKVYNNQRLLKVIRFFQSYYYSGDVNVRRLRLDSIQIGDSTRVNETYKFNYNGNTVPNFITKSTDMWGYYNGAGNWETQSAVPVTQITSYNQDLNPSPPFTVSFNIGKADRTPNPLYAQTGILTGITYPTGGSTHFEYEGNKYMDEGVLKLAGGLRIAKITDIDPVTGSSVERRYTYGIAESGTGFVSNLNRPEDYMTQQNNVYLNYGTHFVTTRNRIYYSSSISDLFFSGGAPVVYNEVKETTVGVSGQELGKTIYKYNYPDVVNGSPNRLAGTNLTFEPRMEWLYGKLITVEQYKSLSSGYELIAKKTYQYSNVFNAGSIHAAKVYRNNNVINLIGTYPTDPHEDITYYPYNINTGATRVAVETDTVHNGSASMVTTKQYQYDNMVNLRPSSIQTTGSDGQTVTESFAYPNNVIYTGIDEFVRQRLIGDNLVNTLLEHHYQKGTAVQKTTSSYYIFNGICLPQTIKSNTGPANLDEERIRFNNYDEYGNLLNVAKAYAPSITYIYGYGGAYPIAQITNSNYSAIVTALGGQSAVDAFRDLTMPSDVAVNSFVNQLRNAPALAGAQVISYTFEPLVGITSMTDAKGQTTYYEYDSFQRLINVKDQFGNILKHTDYHYANQ